MIKNRKIRNKVINDVIISNGETERYDIWPMKVLRQISWCFVCRKYKSSTWEDSSILVGFITSLILRRNNLVLLSMLTERWVNLSIRNDTWKSGVSRSYVAFADSKEDSGRYISSGIAQACMCAFRHTGELTKILQYYSVLRVHPRSLPVGLSGLYPKWRITTMYQMFSRKE